MLKDFDMEGISRERLALRDGSTLIDTVADDVRETDEDGDPLALGNEDNETVG